MRVTYHGGHYEVIEGNVVRADSGELVEMVGYEPHRGRLAPSNTARSPSERSAVTT
jgi:hypothetical protein